MEIKLTLKQLLVGFAASAGDEENPLGIRKLAARLTVLTAHSQRIEAQLAEEIKARQKLETHLAELTTLVAVLAQKGKAPDTTLATQGAPPTATENNEPMSEDDEAAAMAAKALAEAQREMEALNAAAAANGGNIKPAPVTPLRPKASPPAAPAGGDAS